MSYVNSRVFDPQDFALTEEDFLRLDEPRPLGLTGHMRVRNEALTLRASLDSCLPFLDELIITYNDSNDATEEILLEYAALYSQKIRLFWYPLEWGSCRGQLQARPLGHLAHFTNFGYTKLHYAFYIKLDADQVYFTEKMLFIREALLHIVEKVHRGTDTAPPLKSTQEPYAFYEKILTKALTEHNAVTFTLSGLETCYKNNDFYIHTRENLDEMPLFNGIFGDTFLTCPTSAQRFHMQEDYFEVFPHTHTHSVALGLIWVHFGSLKRKIQYPHSDIIPLRKARCFSWNSVYEQINTKATTDIKMHNAYNNVGRRFWERDVHTFVTEEFYELYCARILPLARTYFTQQTVQE